MQTIRLFERYLSVLLSPLFEQALQLSHAIDAFLIERLVNRPHRLNANSLTLRQRRIGIKHNDPVSDMSDVKGCRRRCFDRSHIFIIPLTAISGEWIPAGQENTWPL